MDILKYDNYSAPDDSLLLAEIVVMSIGSGIRSSTLAKQGA
jgi:hypothetical protein